MSDKIKASGSCLCGSVKVTAGKLNTGVGACHCDMCRKWEWRAVYGGRLWAECCL